MAGSVLIVVLLLVASYLLGGVPTAYLVGRRQGVDIRLLGSRNVGTANAGQLFGWPSGLAVLIVDAAKGALPMAIVTLLELPPLGAVAIALAAVAGHNFSPYLRFSGGRGVATTLGASFIVVPWIAAMGFLLGAGWFAATRKVVAAGFVAFGVTNLLVVAVGAPIPILAMCGTTSALVLGTHVVRERRARRILQTETA